MMKKHIGMNVGLMVFVLYEETRLSENKKKTAKHITCETILQDIGMTAETIKKGVSVNNI